MSVITLGFGGPNRIITLGFSSGEQQAETKIGGDDVPRKSPHRGFDLEAWKARHALDDDIEQTIRETYRKASGFAPAIVAEVVKPYIKPVESVSEVVYEPQIDWIGLVADWSAVERLLRLQEEEEIVMVLLQ